MPRITIDTEFVAFVDTSQDGGLMRRNGDRGGLFTLNAPNFPCAGVKQVNQAHPLLSASRLALATSGHYPGHLSVIQHRNGQAYLHSHRIDLLCDNA